MRGWIKVCIFENKLFKMETLLLAISGSALISLVIWLIVIGLIVWLLFWLLSYIGIPEPFNKITRAIIAIVAVVLLINVLLGLTGNAFIEF